MNRDAENRPPIHWRLITDLPITGVDEAIEKIGWYALRWKIELFHKILKSGCRAEEAKLRSAERLVNLLALFLHLGMAGVLADDAQPDGTPSIPTPGLHPPLEYPSARSAGQGQDVVTGANACATI